MIDWSWENDIEKINNKASTNEIDAEKKDGFLFFPKFLRLNLTNVLKLEVLFQ